MSKVAERARVSAIKVSRGLANSPAVLLEPDEENRGAYHELYRIYNRPKPAACK